MPRKSQNNLFGLPERDLAHVLELGAADLEALRGKRIFITGGTGFFGKWLLASLCRADGELGLGLRVTVLSRDPDLFVRQFPEVANVTTLIFVRGQVADFSVEQVQADDVIHAAADTTSAQSEELARAIIDGTQRILELAKRNRARLLFISSGAVYGSQLSAAREEQTGESLTPYGRGKREAEKLCKESGVDFVTARAFAFLGPYLPLDAHFAAGNFLRDARKGGPILVRGDGTALRSYLHPADLVVWLVRMLVRGQRGRAYNVGSNEAVTTAQLAHRIASAVEPHPEVVIQSIQAQGPQNIYLPSIERARAELNLDVAIPLDDAIARTLQFLESSRL